MKKLTLIILSIVIVTSTKGQNSQNVWDSIKSITMPVVLPTFQNQYDTPYKQPLADYGWEDGLQISPNGLASVSSSALTAQKLIQNISPSVPSSPDSQSSFLNAMKILDEVAALKRSTA